MIQNLYHAYANNFQVLLDRVEEDDNFWSSFIICDESSVYGYDIKTG